MESGGQAAARDLDYALRLAATLDEDQRAAFLAARQQLDRQDKQAGGYARSVKSRLERALVVGVTIHSASRDILAGQRFGVCILDEASQATEPLALLGLAAAQASRCVLVGDPKQLPPVLAHASRGGAAPGSEECSLATSLFVRLERAGLRPTVLRTQYRCHPQIADLASRLFYEGALRNGVRAEQRAPLFERAAPLLFVDPSGSEQSRGEGYVNEREAAGVVRDVRTLLAAGVEAKNMGVICCYAAQKALVHSALGEGSEQLTVSTVDAFQGSERDVIFLVTTRTTSLGFLTDLRRLNTSITRARHHLVVYGDRRLLCQNESWAAIVRAATACDSLGFARAPRVLPEVPKPPL